MGKVSWNLERALGRGQVCQVCETQLSWGKMMHQFVKLHLIVLFSIHNFMAKSGHSAVEWNFGSESQLRFQS